MTKFLRKKIMHRSKVRNHFLKERAQKSKDAYNKQINFYVSFINRDIFLLVFCVEQTEITCKK